MNPASQSLLIGAVAAVGVLHTLVPDHWLPITVIGRQRGWSRRETAAAALQAGAGHVLSTMAIGLIVLVAGATVAKHFGNIIDMISTIALIGFGLWVAVSSWHEQHCKHGHSHDCRPALRDNRGKSQMALLLILGSSPMVEAIPAFFAASKFGKGLITAMSAVFAATTIATYVAVCIVSLAGLDRFRLVTLERYGEVLSGAIIVAVGMAFWIWPAL